MWRDHRIASSGLNCAVYLRGQPDAEICMVEDIMGGNNALPLQLIREGGTRW